MTLFMRDQIDREEGFNEGFNEGFKEGFNEGFKEGYKEGAYNKSVEIAKKMIEVNEYMWQDIAEITGLKLAEVEALVNLQSV